MSGERPTIRPVTISRLVEVTDLCKTGPQIDADISHALDVTHRRARETILEAERLELITARDESYITTEIGTQFLNTIRSQNWAQVSKLLEQQSPHYDEFIGLFEEHVSLSPEAALDLLEKNAEATRYKYNQTSLDILGTWAQQLGQVQRNAFAGDFYIVGEGRIDSSFPNTLLSVMDSLDEHAGVNLSKRYFSVPELREHCGQRLGCRRSDFDNALVTLAKQNIGRVELSGAPIDTGAKDARYGVKSISVNDAGKIITTEQSSEQLMRGVEQFGKKYYYVAVYDRDLQFDYGSK